MSLAEAGDDLWDRIQGFRYDPYGFVRFVFDWGQGALEGEEGPDEWQKEFLQNLGERVCAAENEGDAVREATASGHGVGKSALTSWCVLWYMSTRSECQIVVTANTQMQLTTKTWRELALWHKRAINAHWFTHTATKFYHNTHAETWFAAAIPWSEGNSEAFAGTHARHVLYIFDEASAIADVIWEVSEGAMSTTGAVWLAFGNPTKNTGRFRECFRSDPRWNVRHVNSLEAKMVDKKWADGVISFYGPESDQAKVRVYGQFPSQSSNQFISEALVDGAMERDGEGYDYEPRILGIDVARFGDDKTVFCKRQGAKVWPLEQVEGWDGVQIARRAGQITDSWGASIICVDGIGVGASAVDQLRYTNYPVIEVIWARAAIDIHYANQRAECWGLMRDKMEVMDLPEDDELKAQLTAPTYQFQDKTGKLLLERKEDMKKRGLPSPDKADALALTFASPDAEASFVDWGEEDHHHDAMQQGRNPVTGY